MVETGVYYGRMTVTYTPKMKGRLWHFLSDIWPDDRIPVAPGGFALQPKAHWSALEEFILRNAGLFRLPSGSTSKDRIRIFIESCGDDEFESLIKGIPEANMKGGGALGIQTELNLAMEQMNIPARFRPQGLVRITDGILQEYSFDDPLPANIEEVERQLNYYRGRRHEGAENSIFQDQVNLKIDALEIKRRTLSGRADSVSRADQTASVESNPTVIAARITSRRALIVGVIGAVAVITVGVLTNFEKIFGDKKDAGGLSAEVTLDAGTYNAKTLLDSLLLKARGVILDSALAAKIQSRSVVLPPVKGVTLRTVFDQIFHQLGIAVDYVEQSGTILVVEKGKQ